jgi:glycosyltransferase involved in cell wall biosynthesis
MHHTETNPVVSIIMPTYNRAAYILDAIESVRSQGFQDWELIIIDDGSNDNTAAIVTQLKEPRIKFFTVGRTGLISKIRKMGIEKASAEFIAFIDSDDLWANTKLEEQIFALRQNNEIAFCLTGGYNFRQPGVPVDYFYKQGTGMKSGNLFTSFFKSELAVYIQSLMFRRQCLEKESPFKETDNDVDFILRLAKNYKGIVLYKPMLFRRLHDENYSRVNWKRNYQKGIDAIKTYKTEVAPALVRNACFKLYINFGEDCLSNNENKNAISYFLKAWKNKPASFIPIKKIAKTMFRSLGTRR